MNIERKKNMKHEKLEEVYPEVQVRLLFGYLLQICG